MDFEYILLSLPQGLVSVDIFIVFWGANTGLFVIEKCVCKGN